MMAPQMMMPRVQMIAGGTAGGFSMAMPGMNFGGGAAAAQMRPAMGFAMAQRPAYGGFQQPQMMMARQPQMLGQQPQMMMG